MFNPCHVALQVKVWDTSSGFCFVTFNEHLGGITGVTFNQNGQVVLSSSLDGTVRAFDLNRYVSLNRNFRHLQQAPRWNYRCDFQSERPGGAIIVNTVNVVIFAGGKFRENVGKTFHVWVIFTILLLIPS